jgi:microcystin-dependent protein
MADAFLAEIRIFTSNFAPTGWALCDGQILPISQNTALFSLLGTTYGGDGKSTFALPDMQGCAPMHPGQGPGLSLHDLGETGGEPSVTLISTEIPAHTHTVGCSTGSGNVNSPVNATLASAVVLRQGVKRYSDLSPNTNMGPSAIGTVGGNLPHNNRQPYLGLIFIIALQGIFPARS